jgi:hypothetical protein
VGDGIQAGDWRGVGRQWYARAGNGGGELWEDGEGEGRGAARARCCDLHHEAQAYNEACFPHWYLNLSLSFFSFYFGFWHSHRHVCFLVSVEHGIVALKG